MASYPPEALGRVIKEHRRRNRLTQEDLGIRAGYALKGAAVSISRVERGENRPSVDKLGGIASALKVTVDQLEREAGANAEAMESEPVDGSASPGDTRTKIPRRELNERIAAVLEKGRGRQEEVSEVAALVQRHQEKLQTEFLEPFIQIGSRIEGAPAEQWSQESDDSRQQMGENGSAAATHHLQAVSSGLKSAIAGGLLGAGAGAAGGAALGVGAFTAAATFGTASTGTAISALSGIAATNATWAFLGGGALAAGGAGIAGGMAVVASVVAAPVALVALGAGLWARNRSAQKEAEAYRELLDAEREMAEIGPAFDALMEFLRSLESTLNEAATFGTRRFSKWKESLKEPPGRWDDLTDEQRRMFSGLAEVLAAATVVSAIPATQFLALKGLVLEIFADRVSITLAKASDVINKWV